MNFFLKLVGIFLSFALYQVDCHAELDYPDFEDEATSKAYIKQEKVHEKQYLTLAKQGDKNAQYQLIRLYSLECNLNQQTACKQRNDWLIIGDKNDISVASLLLGELYLYGDTGIKKDVTKAIRSYEKAYNAHNDTSSLAATNLAEIYLYYDTHTAGKKPYDYARAKAWLEKAKQEDNADKAAIEERIAFINTLEKSPRTPSNTY